MPCYSAFQKLRSRVIPALKVEVQEYRHIKTGALHYHLAADNPENVFLVAFRTPPTNSCGVTHILEHCILCGSEKYPLRAPYFMMRKRSLATYMNAFTSADWTAYPFASQIRKDYFNLLDVYLDAVFFAKLNPLDFAQEGHRLAVNDEGCLEQRGVVYNEMKGAFNASSSTHWDILCKYLFPTTPYRYVSGGDPAEIPSLSYEQLLTFYHEHYHPSNAVFMTYGDLPVEELHERIDQQALSRFDQQSLVETPLFEEHFTVPVKAQEFVCTDALDEDRGTSSEPLSEQTHHLLAWLIGKSTDLKQWLEAHLLSRLLFQDSASPLMNALESTALGHGPSHLCGLEDSNAELSLVCGIQGSDPKAADAFESLVLATLNEIAINGVDKARLDAVLHQLELDHRDISDDAYPYGLQVILSALPTALQVNADKDALSASLDLEPVMLELRTAVSDPEYIKTLIRERVLENMHRVRLSLLPDTTLKSRRQSDNKEKLTQMLAKMSDQQRQQLFEQESALEERQSEEENSDILPKLTVQEIPVGLKGAQGKRFMTNPSIPITCFEQGTNGLLHQQLVIEMPYLEEELLQALPFYTACLTELGCGGKNYQQTQAWRAEYSEGIHASCNMRGSLLDVQQTKGYFTLATRGLSTNHQAMTEMLYNALTMARFDELPRIKSLIAQQRLSADHYVADNGHILAKRTASSGFSPAASFVQRLSGLRGIKSLRAFDNSLRSACNDSLAASMAAKFERIHYRLATAPKQFMLVGESADFKCERQILLERWQGTHSQDAQIQGMEFQPFTLEPVSRQIREIWTTDTQVNFCSIAYPTVAINHPDSAALHVLGELVRHEYLHPIVRERGGAYGSGCSQDSNIGAFRMCSYRDPRSVGTLEDFGEATGWLQNCQFTQQHVDSAVFAMISYMDKPVSPASDAKQVFHNALYGRTLEQREFFRERVLNISLDDLVRVRETYLSPDKASIAVITHCADDLVDWAGEHVFEIIKL
ncbi:insulinase family protein [Neptunomonas japonica]|uniref:Peptidase M16 n=1 Tax=Neptunomonas japonica JAMM 1380 TaxID=1441457 RepID=A0A7R6PL96_9GAMM|nr:insulinase family protein [Neptunomonas japonica]BBB31206.1 peptidase M16 [Neptunomonas japonica JAMM 1380]